jgi:hypothetical protein
VDEQSKDFKLKNKEIVYLRFGCDNNLRQSWYRAINLWADKAISCQSFDDTLWTTAHAIYLD